MVFVVLGPFGHRCHPLREGEEEVPQTKPKHEISILAEMSPKKNLEKQSCFPCMGNALKTSLVGFQPHGAEKSPLGALTLGSEWLQAVEFSTLDSELSSMPVSSESARRRAPVRPERPSVAGPAPAGAEARGGQCRHDAHAGHR